MRSVNDYIPTLIGVVIYIYVLFRLYRLSNRAGRSVPLVFFAFGTAAILLSSLYWLAFDLLYPLQRLPFAANEIAEWAMFISLGSVLSAMLTSTSRSAWPEIVFAVIFMTANVALWIVWSGEWLQDIITGIVFGYLIINLLRMLKETGVFTRALWALFGLVCTVIIALNIASLLVQETLRNLCDLAAYILLGAVGLYFIIRAFLSIYRKADTKVTVAFSTAVVVWGLISLYMSAGMFYNIANISVEAGFLLMLLSLRREAVS